MTLHEQVSRDYVEMREDVFRYLVTIGVRPQEAQEMTQESFLRLFVALKKGENIRSTRGWIFRVAHNLGVKSRMRKDPAESIDERIAIRLADRGAGPEKEVLEKEEVERVQEAFAKLSPQQRQCLFLRAEGLRYREIADTIGVTISTVNEFLNRGFEKLRKASQ